MRVGTHIAYSVISVYKYHPLILLLCMSPTIRQMYSRQSSEDRPQEEFRL